MHDWQPLNVYVSYAQGFSPATVRVIVKVSHTPVDNDTVEVALFKGRLTHRMKSERVTVKPNKTHTITYTDLPRGDYHVSVNYRMGGLQRSSGASFRVFEKE